MTPRGRLGILSALMGVNVGVFILWAYATSFLADGAAPERFMTENFTTSAQHLAQGRYWTLLTSAFSHSEIWHILMNMLVLRSFGPVLLARWGPQRFLVFYLVAAVAASLSHAGVGWLMERDARALGASGAISGLLAAFAIYYPRQRVLLFAVLPMPAYLMMILFVGLDVWGLVEQSQGGGLPIGHGAHLGGAAFGALFSLLTDARVARVASMPSLAEQRELHRILDKVERRLGALTENERAFLEYMSRRYSSPQREGP